MQAKNNQMGDFSSRNPLWEENSSQGPMITDDFGREIPIKAHINMVQTLNKYKERILNDPLLDEMIDVGSMDKTYTAH